MYEKGVIISPHMAHVSYMYVCVNGAFVYDCMRVSGYVCPCVCVLVYVCVRVCMNMYVHGEG